VHTAELLMCSSIRCVAYAWLVVLLKGDRLLLIPLWTLLCRLRRSVTCECETALCA
jgi:hypothetical protein